MPERLFRQIAAAVGKELIARAHSCRAGRGTGGLLPRPVTAAGVGAGHA